MYKTHSLSYHPLYQTWYQMMRRCNNPKAHNYTIYGARGIKVCQDWQVLGNYIEWIEQNIGKKPVGMTIDRIDNDGNYEPGNVRWATANLQGNNRNKTNITGEKQHFSKLTTKKVLKIRELSAKGWTQTQLAKKFYVSQPAIGCIVRRATWKHI